MDKAKTNLGHGQRLDKLWTKFGQTMDKDWTLRPEFVRPTILQECRIFELNSQVWATVDDNEQLRN